MGIPIDDKLSWREQVGFVCKKVTKSLGILRKIRDFVHSSCFLTLYYTLIYPYLTYCNIVWASTFPSYLHKILLLQKRFVRLATFSKAIVPSSPLFFKLQLLTIFDINILQVCTFVFQVRQKTVDLPLGFRYYYLLIILNSIIIQFDRLRIFIYHCINIPWSIFYQIPWSYYVE